MNRILPDNLTPTNMKPNRFTFPNSEGIMLSAQMEWPANQQPHNYAIFAHCFTCNKNFHAVRAISKALAGRGFAILSFDFTGLGQSEGNFEDADFSGNVKDIVSAARFLEDKFRAPTLLLGHSLGGAAVIQAAEYIETVRAIATIGSPAKAEHVKKVFEEHLPAIGTTGMTKVDLGGRPFLIRQQFVDDLRNHVPAETLRRLKKAILILHSPQDRIVGIENAAQLYQEAHHPKSFISLDGADHLLTKKSDSGYAGEVIAAWASRYLDIPGEPSLESEYQTVALTGDKESGYTTLIKAGKHCITADEPEDVGGNDFGPTPYQLLASSLAACTAMTLRMYANRKSLDIEEIKVHVTHSKRYSDDAVHDNQMDARIERFERLVEVEGDIDEKQRKRIIEIANKCPVHKTLEGRISITTRYFPQKG